MSEQHKNSLSVERGLTIGLAGLCGGLIVGAIAFRSDPPPRADAPVATATAPNLRVTESKRSELTSRTPAPVADSASPNAALPEGPIPGLEAMAAPSGVMNDNAPTPANAPEPTPTAAGDAGSSEEAEPAVAAPSKGMTSELKDAVAADRWFRKVRLRLHKRIGTDALVNADGLTAPGLAIMQRVRSLADHGIDPMPYNAASLEDRAQRFETTADRAALEAHLGRALTRLVLDWRVLKTAGPFGIVTEAKVGQDVKRQRELVKLAAEFAGAKTVEEALAVIDPPHVYYQGLVAAHKEYRRIADAGGCEKVPLKRLRNGSKGKAVRALEARLACEGYYQGEPDGAFDDALEAALKTYQRHHEIDDDGVLTKPTVKSLNVSIERRADQIRLAVHRLRESKVRKMQDYHLVVNLPAFELRAVAGGKVIKRNKVIVGTNRLDDDKVALVQGHLNRTKLLTSRLYEVIVNPSWILPERIAKGELKGSLAKDPDYLQKKGIREKTLPNGSKVFVQRGGDGNVLGKVKFLLEKTNAIYLHDTDKPWLFKKRRRDFSHGCMRVHEAVDFAKWLLERDGWDMKEVKRALGAEVSQRGFKLKKAPTFMTEYLTVDLSDEGKPRFLTDIYKYDKAYFAGNLPPKTRTRWGAVRLRPHWVPRVPSALVKEWRASGKAAPRDPKWRPPKEG